MRFAAGIEYDGSGFHGWQRQDHVVSVQASVEDALSAVAAHPVDVICAGRTDAGVHATSQVIHFDSDAQRDLHGWLLGANTNLPQGVSMTWLQPVDDAFDARRSALYRSYRYIILNRRVRPAILRGQVGWQKQPLDVDLMHEASRCLIGEHDFNSFRAAQCQAKHAIRRLDTITIQRRSDLVYIDVVGNAFLHHMVRNIVGTLMQVGNGLSPVEWVADVLAARDRKAAGYTAPAEGLYLAGVRYPEKFGLPELLHLPELF